MLAAAAAGQAELHPSTEVIMDGMPRCLWIPDFEQCLEVRYRFFRNQFVMLKMAGREDILEY